MFTAVMSRMTISCATSRTSRSAPFRRPAGAWPAEWLWRVVPCMRCLPLSWTNMSEMIKSDTCVQRQELRREIILEEDPAGMKQHVHQEGSLTGTAVQATLHCLTGCAIGEILGMVVATAVGLGDAASIAVSVMLAFVFGYALTLRPAIAAGIPLRRALGLTFASDTVSIATMELLDNLFIVIVPGALAAGLSDGLFWSSLLTSLVV